MHITIEAADKAFAAFHVRYVEQARRAWDIDHHIRLWADARASVEGKDNGEGFLRTLEELRSHWQIARGKGAVMLDFPRVLPLLQDKAASALSWKLSTVTEDNAIKLFQIVSDVACIKQVMSEPSLMAISKVLHFYNPRLFMIVDRAMVWDWALSRRWVWAPFEAVRKRIDPVVGCDVARRNDAACDIASYVAILIGGGELLRANPHVA
jgi:hypothetical protein